MVDEKAIRAEFQELANIQADSLIHLLKGIEKELPDSTEEQQSAVANAVIKTIFVTSKESVETQAKNTEQFMKDPEFANKLKAILEDINE